jgi:hypothetical protein
LQTRATTTDHGQAQSAFGPTLFLKQGTQAPRGILRDADQLFIADLNSGLSRTGGMLRCCFAHKLKVTLSG